MLQHIQQVCDPSMCKGADLICAGGVICPCAGVYAPAHMVVSQRVPALCLALGFADDGAGDNAQH